MNYINLCLQNGDPEAIGAVKFVHCQAQPKPQLSWAKWLYFQLIQHTHPHPPGKVYFLALALVKTILEHSRWLQHRLAIHKLVGSYPISDY